jgi:hypothetical protein
MQSGIKGLNVASRLWAGVARLSLFRWLSFWGGDDY